MSKSTRDQLRAAVQTTIESLEGRRLLSVSSSMYVPDELVVEFQPGATGDQIAEVRAAVSAGLKNSFSRGNGHGAGNGHRSAVEVLSLSGGTSVESAMSRLAAHPAVARVEPNYRTEPALTPNDPSFNQLWGLHNTGRSGATADADIDAPEAWNITTGSSDVVVFVLDTGIDYTHPDLAANMWQNPFEIPGNGIDDEGNGYVDDIYGIDTINHDSDPMDDAGHGTHVAGTIGARGNNGIGVAGVNWNVKIGVVKHLGGNGGTNASLIEAFEYVNDLKSRGVNVVVTNNSYRALSGHGYSGPFEGGIARSAMDGPLGMEKILHVVAAGNDTLNNDGAVEHPVAWPASWNLDNILSVAATDRKDQVASFSNWGANTVDLAAPGVSIYSTMPNNSYGTMSGTSMATPHVAGAAALVAAARPGLAAEAIKLALMDATDNIGNIGSNASRPTVTNGRLNVHKALVNLGGGDTTAPAAVSDLTVSSAGLWSAELAWTATGDNGLSGTARSYDVRYSTSPITEQTWDDARSAAIEPRPAPAGAAEAFRVQRLERATSYYFAMKVRDESGNESALSNVVSAATAQPTVAFADDFENGLGQWTVDSPWGLTTTKSHTGNYSVADSPAGNYGNNVDASLTTRPIDLSNLDDTQVTFWSDGISEFGVDYYRVQASGDGGATWTTLASYTGVTDGWWLYVLDLSAYDGQADVRLRYRLQSNGSTTFDGRYIDDVEVVGKALPPDTAAPTAPSNLVSTGATNTSISLAWGAASDDRAVAAYDVYRVDGGGDVKVGETTGTSHTVTALSSGTSYTFYVVARDAAGNVSPQSNALTASTTSLAVPAAPTGLTGTKLNKSRVRLNWSDQSSNETGFRVWSSRDGVTWTLLATAGANATSYTTGTLAGGAWHFRVSAFNGAGESAFTNTITVNM